jgi:AraC-like DNA-binding protein
VIARGGTGAESLESRRHRVSMVRSESLSFFDELVRDKGGDPTELLNALRIPPEALATRDSLIPYRSMVLLLEHAASTLECPDFGLQLARRQYSDGILGALDIAMRNSRTVGEAWRFCVDHVHVYCADTRLSLSQCSKTDRRVMRFEILLPRLYRQRQAVELSLLISHLATKMISGGRAAAREVWFTHDPVSDQVRYADYFDSDVRFARPCNALYFDDADFAAPVVGRNERVLELATYFLDSQFPACAAAIKSRVRCAIEEQLGKSRCTYIEVAAALGMHPRTLQRHLHSEGEKFEAMKDEVRRDAVMRYLRDTRLPLKTIAAMLGYSETSVLVRCCRRWFGQSPGALRQMHDAVVH